MRLLSRPRCQLPVRPGTFCTRCDVSRYLLKHACSETHAHSQRCSLAFRVQRVSWKIGLKAEPVARQRLCHIWYFFFVLASFSFSHTDSVDSVPDISMLDVNSYKSLQLTMRILFYGVLSDSCSPIWHTLSTPPHSGLAQKLNILPRNTVRHAVEQKTWGKWA